MLLSLYPVIYSTPPAPALTLMQVLHLAIKGVTGLPADRVRPSWQPDPPLRPARTTDWCGYRVAGMTPDANPVITTQGDAGTLQRNESGEWAVSFYGPQCQDYAGALRDGLHLPLNRESLRKGGIVVQGEGKMTHAPELIDDIWYDRADVSFQITHEVKRAYPILSFVSASGFIRTEHIIRKFSTEPRPWSSLYQ